MNFLVVCSEIYWYVITNLLVLCDAVAETAHFSFTSVSFSLVIPVFPQKWNTTNKIVFSGSFCSQLTTFQQYESVFFYLWKIILNFIIKLFQMKLKSKNKQHRAHCILFLFLKKYATIVYLSFGLMFKVYRCY
jgi:CBS domain containing-hemolysin-like protein